MSIVVGIDVGGSTTKIVAFRHENGEKELIKPQFVKANDPMTSIYGAFGKFTDENGIALSDIDKVMMTGVGSSFVRRGLYGLECISVPEFRGIGLGGLYISGLDEALVVSMGTGTALVHAKHGGQMRYLGGTGVGGGTLMGLSKLLLNAETVEHIIEFAEAGNLTNIDLKIKDLTAEGSMSELSRDLTASNFGNVSDLATKEDISAGIVNLVLETVGMTSVFAARATGVKNVILTGNITKFNLCKTKFLEFDDICRADGIKFTTPELSPYATAIGTALCGFQK